jgi:signal transduction histidine kinase
VLFVIFGISSFLQWECAQEIKKVSEYHRSMSIPAISILNDIKLSFQEIHISSIETVEKDLVNENEGHHSYQENKNKFLDSIEKYKSLAHIKNSNGEFLANEMMQMEMENYTQNYQELIKSNDLVIEQFENEELSNSDSVLQLASIEFDFHNTVEKNTQMEIRGMEEIQAKIIDIEKQMETIFYGSGIIAIVSTSIIMIFTTRFVTVPISKLIKVTKEISKGESIKINKNFKNSDVNDILIALQQMSNELQEYKSKIIMQEKLSSIGELASRLAHDIKNPLTIIKVTLDMIKTKNKNLTPEEIEKFERVDTAMYRITHQIDNVLDFIKGKPLKFQKYQIKEILDSVIADLPKSNKISMEIVSEESEIECDFEAMKVILINLTVNAIQAIKDNEGKIKISSKIRGDNVIIEIEDSGPGIPEEILEKIFEPLYTTKEEGTGLGLVSCKSLLDQHHGKISVKNNPTRFIIELPKNIKQKTE